jgi:alkanesulfonate monooxygenase SsuD/methylene tetrahydromethanopterin reductase-like flavin-dependent oxidoreductase (luciferase family)
VLAEEIAFHDQVEELGFDSLWTIEHHFTPYTMVNNPIASSASPSMWLGRCSGHLAP